MRARGRTAVTEAAAPSVSERAPAAPSRDNGPLDLSVSYSPNMSAVGLLTAAEEIELARKIQVGCRRTPRIPGG